MTVQATFALAPTLGLWTPPWRKAGELVIPSPAPVPDHTIEVGRDFEQLPSGLWTPLWSDPSWDWRNHYVEVFVESVALGAEPPTPFEVLRIAHEARVRSMSESPPDWVVRAINHLLGAPARLDRGDVPEPEYGDHEPLPDNGLTQWELVTERHAEAGEGPGLLLEDLLDQSTIDFLNKRKAGRPRR